jgi:serine/threonine protein kinase
MDYANARAVIGEGAFGKVYCVVHKDLKIPCAVKVIKSAMINKD